MIEITKKDKRGYLNLVYQGRCISSYSVISTVSWVQLWKHIQISYKIPSLRYVALSASISAGELYSLKRFSIGSNLPFQFIDVFLVITFLIYYPMLCLIRLYMRSALLSKSVILQFAQNMLTDNFEYASVISQFKQPLEVCKKRLTTVIVFQDFRNFRFDYLLDGTSEEMLHLLIAPKRSPCFHNGAKFVRYIQRKEENFS